VDTEYEEESEPDESFQEETQPLAKITSSPILKKTGDCNNNPIIVKNGAYCKKSICNEAAQYGINCCNIVVLVEHSPSL
jgi:hypothetical protein